jgi:DNA-directed RNA polymerase specialized sigma24 family protein
MACQPLRRDLGHTMTEDRTLRGGAARRQIEPQCCGEADTPLCFDVEAELRRYHQDSFGWALACCRWVATEAEEVLRETYLKVLEGRARFDGRSHFKTWLFAVLRRTAAERRRQAYVRPRPTGR